MEKTKSNRVELDKHRHNSREILLCTNATPIRNHRGIGYTCSFCKVQYANPADLKTHTMQEHCSDTQLLMKDKSWSSYYLKLDITGLRCNLCNVDINTVESLIPHLADIHSKKMFTDIKQRILPFKFDTDKLTCFMCYSVFAHFKGLQEHMHIHYRNYVCDVCAVGFASPYLLSRHSYTHKTGTYKCTKCPLVFDTLSKQLHHLHTHTEIKRNICGYCNERFKENRDKYKHLALVHGIEQKVVCQSCGKTFGTALSLRQHMKRVHLMEKRFKCSECPMEFCTSSELNRHMVKHTGKKDFQCAVCYKTYGRRKTLVEHMKIHNNDRRFKCERCGLMFVQKCSWRGHMRNKHGEDV